MIQNNLGNTYRDLPADDRAANLEQAIQCYQQALQIWTPDADSQRYALLQTNLGNAYAELLAADRVVNLERAIRCFQEALRFRTPERDSQKYALICSSLGNAYSELPTGERETNVIQAIQAYQEALHFYIPDADPMKYAETQLNLGAAYHERRAGGRAAHLAQAVQAYQEALRFFTLEPDPVKYAQIQNNLSMANQELLAQRDGSAVPPGFEADICQMHQLEEQSQGDPQSLDALIQAYLRIIDRLQPEQFPILYSDIQDRLGTAYSELPAGNRGNNLAEAITCYQEALRFRTPRRAPQKHAVTLVHLGNAL